MTPRPPTHDSSAADGRLVAATLAGDRRAYDALFDLSFRRVHAYVTRRVPGDEPAKELTAQILSDVFADLDCYDAEVPYAAWLLRYTRERTLKRITSGAPAAWSPGSRPEVTDSPS